jgi:MFS transporter, putative metabolite:H+ symporter
MGFRAPTKKGTAARDGGERMAQTIEAYVGEQMDNATMGRTHWWVLGLVASGYFCDVIDYTMFGAMTPDMIQSGFLTAAGAATVNSVTLVGLFIGALGQGEFTDRFGRKAVYQFNLLLFGVATIAGAWMPNLTLLLVCRFFAGIGLGAEQPLCFSYTVEYAPKRIRGRIIALMQFIGGAWPWPVGALFVLYFRDIIHWRGIWTVVGILALIVFVLRVSLPESPRWLATHGQGQRALDILKRMGLKTVPIETLSTDAASDTKSDPFGIIFRAYPSRVIAGMICFVAFFGVALGLGAWLPNMMATTHGFTINKSLVYTVGMTLAFPLASGFMMYALEKYGRKVTSVAAFVLAGIAAACFAFATSDVVFFVVGFIMIFFIQLAGNSSQIFISEVFPTNARASGFGISQSAGRLASAFIIPMILVIQLHYGLAAVFIAIAISLIIAAIAVISVGPESRGLALDEVAPPTG